MLSQFSPAVEPSFSLKEENISQTRLVPGRFVLVDALRGFAAIIVVVFHVWHANISAVLHLELPAPLETIVRHGYVGVPIFFVLSGFVIAHSIFRQNVVPQFLGRFILRRSLRLDPPYWASIVLAISLLALSRWCLNRPNTMMPSATDIAIHLLYLQEYLGVREIVPVYWTLCYEIQFYVVFVALVGLGHWRSRSGSHSRMGSMEAIIFASLWCLSLLIANGYLRSPPGLFVDRWYQFFAGTAAYWAYRGYMPVWALVVVLAGTIGTGGTADAIRNTVIGTSAILFLAGRSGHLFSLSGGKTMQMLGRISYSLYLTHLVVGCRIAHLSAASFPDMGLTAAVLLLAFSVTASIGFAQAFYWAFERPSIAWSKAVSLSSGDHVSALDLGNVASAGTEPG